MEPYIDSVSVDSIINPGENVKQKYGFGFQNNVRIDSGAITSIYGKGGAINQLYQAALDRATGKFSLLYANKKEADSLLHRAGHQLSGSLIPRDGFCHSIREKGSPVKSRLNDVTDRGYLFYDITQIERLPVNGGQTETNSVAASGNLSIKSIPNSTENVNTDNNDSVRYNSSDIETGKTKNYYCISESATLLGPYLSYR